MKGNRSNQAMRQWVWSAGVPPATYVDEPILMDVTLDRLVPRHGPAGDAGNSNDCDPDTTAQGETGQDRRCFYHQPLTRRTPRSGIDRRAVAKLRLGRRVKGQDRQPLTRRLPHGGTDRGAIAELRSDRCVKGNWNVLGLTEDAVVRKYTWGLDLAGQGGASASGRSALEGAGGIGGLLAVEQPQAGGNPLKYLYLYDANGNVGQVIDPAASSALASIKVKYEYDPYGRRTNPAMIGEYDQPFRFSTKYFDTETGLYYFGYRYYHPGLGRWISRDPIEEDGGTNLYTFVGNSPAIAVDPVGLQNVDPRLLFPPASAPAPPPPGPSGCCGPDITESLRAALDRLATRFRAYGTQPIKQYRMCRSMASGNGWDISELIAWASRSGKQGEDRFNRNGCGSGTCGGSIQVFGKCYNAAEVNYILWGRAWSLCAEASATWTVSQGSVHGRDVLWYVFQGEPPQEYQVWTLDWALDRIYLYYYTAGWLARHTFHPPNDVGAGSAKCRVHWTLVGWGGGPTDTVPSECEIAGCSTKCCKQPYQGDLSGHVGTGDGRIGF